jgi:ribosome-associated protein
MVKKNIVALSKYLSELAVQGIQEKKGEDIVRLDLRNIHTSVADYFIVCSANSGTQVKAIADIFKTEKRHFYGIEELWGDAETTNFKSA